MKQITVSTNEKRVVPLLWTGQESTVSYDIVLAEPGAELQFVAVLIGKNQSAGQLSIKVTHAAERTKSQVIVKGTLRDKSQLNIDGLVKLESGAKGADAWLAAHLLLLSESATGQAIPSLEILENDVTAAHAATIGRLEDEQLFYAMSRGLSENQSRELLVEGFLSSALAALPATLAAQAKKELAHV